MEPWFLIGCEEEGYELQTDAGFFWWGLDLKWHSPWAEFVTDDYGTLQRVA